MNDYLYSMPSTYPTVSKTFMIKAVEYIHQATVEKKNHIVLTNYKYTKSLFLNTLRCNHLPTKIKKTQNNIVF